MIYVIDTKRVTIWTQAFGANCQFVKEVIPPYILSNNDYIFAHTPTDFVVRGTSDDITPINNFRRHLCSLNNGFPILVLYSGEKIKNNKKALWLGSVRQIFNNFPSERIQCLQTAIPSEQLALKGMIDRVINQINNELND